MSNSKGCYWCGCCEFGVRVSRIGVAKPNLALEAEVDADLDTLVTALYVTTDDFLIDNPQHRPWRPKVGITPRLDDAELVTLVVLASTARVHLGGQVAALCEQPSGRAVPLSANPIGLQQTGTRRGRDAARGHRASGCAHLSVH